MSGQQGKEFCRGSSPLEGSKCPPCYQRPPSHREYSHSPWLSHPAPILPVPP